MRNKVTIDDVNAAIVGETYTLLPNGRTTVCQLTLDNGFTVEGLSACVSKENYNEEIGNRLSRERAVEKVWMVLGFRLADELDLVSIPLEVLHGDDIQIIVVEDDSSRLARAVSYTNNSAATGGPSLLLEVFGEADGDG